MPWKFRDDETITAFGMMTSLQVHVTGYLTHVDEKTGEVKGKQITFRKGHGKETYFKNLGLVHKERIVEDTCRRIWSLYMEGQKVTADGTLVGDNITPATEQAVVFHDNRNDPKPIHKKKFYNKNKPNKIDSAPVKTKAL